MKTDTLLEAAAALAATASLPLDRVRSRCMECTPARQCPLCRQFHRNPSEAIDNMLASGWGDA